eukprot:s10752_g4.t1
MHAHELRFCAQAYRLKIFFNAWYNAAQLRKVEDEGVDAWFCQHQESIRLRCDLYRLSNDARLGEAEAEAALLTGCD